MCGVETTENAQTSRAQYCFAVEITSQSMVWAADSISSPPQKLAGEDWCCSAFSFKGFGATFAAFVAWFRVVVAVREAHVRVRF